MATVNPTPQDDLHERIGAWLRAKGLSQRQLAKAVGVTPSAVSYWLSKDKRKRETPTTDNLTKIVNVFGLTMPEFYGRLPAAKKRRAA